MLLKAGASFDYRPLAFGVAITLPSLNLFGSGSTYYNDSVVNVDIDVDGIRDSYLTSDYQEGLSSSYSSPLSISAGTSYGYKRTTLHFSAEYFLKRDTYDILEPKKFRSQSTGDTLAIAVTGGMEDVFNFGFGIDHKFSNNFSIYGGFTTDRTGYRSDVITTTTSWDLYHISLGAAFRAFEIDWNLGMGISWGSDDLDLAFEFADDAGSDEVISPEGVAAAMDYNRLKFIIGFSLPVKEKG
jgi:hypothetical protein